jgi:hypothetical protein
MAISFGHPTSPPAGSIYTEDATQDPDTRSRPTGYDAARACRSPACGRRYTDQAEVKLADSLGDSAWACLPHAEEILVAVTAALHRQP